MTIGGEEVEVVSAVTASLRQFSNAREECIQTEPEPQGQTEA